MNAFKFLSSIVMGFSFLHVSSIAQETNVVVPPTILEAMEQTTNQLIVKGFTPVGGIAADGAEISIVCKADAIPSTNRKEYGVAVEIRSTSAGEDRAILDFDELDSLLGAFDFLSNANWSITPLSGFDASYTSKAGLCVTAFSSKRLAGIQFAVRSGRMQRRILLTPDQWGRLRSMIEQAKGKLDGLRKS